VREKVRVEEKAFVSIFPPGRKGEAATLRVNDRGVSCFCIARGQRKSIFTSNGRVGGDWLRRE